jgi:hypothetical protein
MSAPIQKPGKSRQDYGTPALFLDAVRRQFGSIDIDLACRRDNMVARRGIVHGDLDALSQDWSDPMYFDREDNVIESGADIRVAFCNPPFADIEPWAEKAASCSQLSRWTLLLVPASIDAKWYTRHVLGQAMVWGIPRVTFVGETTPFPKALALIGYGYNVHGHGYWRWR